MFLNDLSNLCRSNVLCDITGQFPNTWGQVPSVNTWGQVPTFVHPWGQISNVSTQIPYNCNVTSQIPYLYNYPTQVGSQFTTGQFPFHYGTGYGNFGVPFGQVQQPYGVPFGQVQQPYNVFTSRIPQTIGIHPFNQYGHTGLYGQHWNVPFGFQGTFCR